jgi:hypothetical protein
MMTIDTDSLKVRYDRGNWWAQFSFIAFFGLICLVDMAQWWSGMVNVDIARCASHVRSSRFDYRSVPNVSVV